MKPTEIFALAASPKFDAILVTPNLKNGTTSVILFNTEARKKVKTFIAEIDVAFGELDGIIFDQLACQDWFFIRDHSVPGHQFWICGHRNVTHHPQRRHARAA